MEEDGKPLYASPYESLARMEQLLEYHQHSRWTREHEGRPAPELSDSHAAQTVCWERLSALGGKGRSDLLLDFFRKEETLF